MAKQQSFVPILTAHDEICNWEFINQSDFEDGDEVDSIYELEIIDFAETLSSSASSEVDDDHVHDPEEQAQEEGPTEMQDLDARDDQNEDDDDDDTMVGSPPTHEEVNFSGVVELGHSIRNCAADVEYSSHRQDYYPDGLRNLYHDYDDHNEDDHQDDDEDEDGGYYMDDELVPWEVKNRFERQRMRKLGKRAFAKMVKSKKSAHIYTRPGCVRGKHGLGLKAY